MRLRRAVPRPPRWRCSARSSCRGVREALGEGLLNGSLEGDVGEDACQVDDRDVGRGDAQAVAAHDVLAGELDAVDAHALARCRGGAAGR